MKNATRRDLGTHISKALTPEECEIMRHFLGALQIAAEKNPKLSVWKFVQEYRYYYSGYGPKGGYKPWRSKA